MSDINPGVIKVNDLVQKVDEFEELPGEHQEALDEQAARRAAIAMKDPESICALILRAGLARLLSEGKGDSLKNVRDGRVSFENKEDDVALMTVERKGGIIDGAINNPKVLGGLQGITGYPGGESTLGSSSQASDGESGGTYKEDQGREELTKVGRENWVILGEKNGGISSQKEREVELAKDEEEPVVQQKLGDLKVEEKAGVGDHVQIEVRGETTVEEEAEVEHLKAREIKEQDQEGEEAGMKQDVAVDPKEVVKKMKIGTGETEQEIGEQKQEEDDMENDRDIGQQNEMEGSVEEAIEMKKPIEEEEEDKKDDTLVEVEEDMKNGKGEIKEMAREEHIKLVKTWEQKDIKDELKEDRLEIEEQDSEKRTGEENEEHQQSERQDKEEEGTKTEKRMAVDENKEREKKALLDGKQDEGEGGLEEERVNQRKMTEARDKSKEIAEQNAEEIIHPDKGVGNDQERDQEVKIVSPVVNVTPVDVKRPGVADESRRKITHKTLPEDAEPQTIIKGKVTAEITSKKRGFWARIFGRHSNKEMKTKKTRKDRRPVQEEQQEGDRMKKPSKLTAIIFACCCVQPVD